MNNLLTSVFVLVLSIISLLTVISGKIPVSHAQTPVIGGPIIVTGNPISYPSPTLTEVTPVNTQPGPSLQPVPSHAPLPTIGPTIGIDPQMTPIALPTAFFYPTQPPISTPTVIPIPTIGIIGYIPTATPTPVSYWYLFGPKGVPSSTWDTAEKILQQISTDETNAVEIDEWKYGGWSSHIKGLPFNNFSINEGVGYFIKFNGKPERNIQKMLNDYQSSKSITYSIQTGWNLISIPNKLTGYIKPENAEGLCKSVNSQKGRITEVSQHKLSDQAGLWKSHTCGEKRNNFEIKSGEGYFLKAMNPSSWTLASDK